MHTEFCMHVSNHWRSKMLTMEAGRNVLSVHICLGSTENQRTWRIAFLLSVLSCTSRSFMMHMMRQRTGESRVSHHPFPFGIPYSLPSWGEGVAGGKQAQQKSKENQAVTTLPVMARIHTNVCASCPLSVILCVWDVLIFAFKAGIVLYKDKSKIYDSIL